MPAGRTTSAAFVWLTLVACKEEPPPTELVEMTPQESDSATGSEETDTDDGDQLEPGADICSAAASVGPGLYRGDLRDMESNNGGACELGGPDVFFNIEVPRRADVMLWARGGGYEPRVGVRHSDCTVSFEQRGLLCVAGIPGWISDVALGTRLIVSVGIDPAAPALAGTEALPFDLEVAFRPVLEEGERCEPQSVGRCETGTHCTVEPESDGPTPAVCVAVPGDTCQSALPLVLRPGSLAVEIPADAIHSDAHQHSCVGARSPDRVYRVELVGDLGADARVEVDAPMLAGLAARGPGCLPEQELGLGEGGDPACAADGEPLVVAAPPRSFYLFAELPDAASRDPTGGEEAPLSLTISFDPG